MFNFIKLHKIRSVYGLPLLINLVLALVVSYVLFELSGYVIGWLEGVLIGEGSNAFLEVVLVVLVHVLFWSMGFVGYQYLSLIFIAPFLSFIAEDVMNKLEGKDLETEWGNFLPLLLRGARVTLRNLFLQLLISVLVYLLLSWFVVTVVLIPFILFGINAYFMGYAFLDYISEYKNLSFEESKEHAKGRTGLMLGVGTYYQLILFIPVFGVLFAPSLSVVIMCMAYFDNEKRPLSINEGIIT